LLYAPTALVWAAAFAVGPGFAVGAGTQVTFAGVDLGAVPAVPLLAALPGDGAPGPTALMALLVPVVAGVVAGRLVDRRDAALPESELGTWRRLAGLAAAAGGLAGLAVAALCALTSGPGGPGRLAEVGPSPWWVGLAAAGEVGLVAAATLLLRHRGLLSRPGDADLSG
ncbi:MAG: cell division protein PerM, partial [Nocardioidaceae bacterium]